METHHRVKCPCGETKKTKRCSSCKLISYCSKQHQMDYRSEHNKLCKVVAEILKKKEKSHIFENIDSTEFNEEKCRIVSEVEKKLKRPLNQEELVLFEEPRLCFVCREANQDKLITCQKCLITSFCNLHPTSQIHERFCIIESAEITKDTTFKFDMNSSMKSQINSFLKGMKHLKEDDSLPTSTIDFFDSFTREKFSPKDKILLSEYISIPLTICSSLRTLFSPIPSKVQIHLKSRHCAWTILCLEVWEIILHLLPEVKTLEIVYIEDELQSTDKVKMNLCKECKLKRKSIQVKRNPTVYERPTLIAIFSSSPSLEKKILQNIFNMNGENVEVQKLPCPIVITSSCEDIHKHDVELFLKKFKNYEIVFNNYNEYSSLLKADPEKLFFRHSLFVAIIKPNDEKKSNAIKITSHYPQLCHYCKKQEGKLQCKHCRVVYYCDKKHENQDKIHHSELCEVIFRMRKEIVGGKQLYHEAAKLEMDEENWLKTRLEMLRNAEMRIKRKLTKEEEEIFLFPRACGICHEIDASLLKNCECGVFLCKKHKSDPEHKKACSDLSIAFKVSTRQPIVNENLSIINEIPEENLMKNFVAAIFSLLDEIFINEMFNKGLSPEIKLLNSPSDCKMTVKGDHSLKKMFTTNFLSSPMTLFYALEKMNVQIKSSMTIHVIGAKLADFEKKFLWAFLFLNLEKLDVLKLIFIDSEFIDCPEIPVKNYSQMKINLKIEGHALSYEKYLSSKKFIKPDIIIGCNLEKKSTKSEIFSEKAILSLKKLQVPLVLTAGTKERAEKIHSRIFAANNLSYKFFEENPFASLKPERDFETTGVNYYNEYLFGYDFQDLANSTTEEAKQEVRESTDISTKNDFESKEEKVPTTEILSKKDLKSNKKVSKSNKKSTKTDIESKEKIFASSKIMAVNNLESREEKVSATEISMDEHLKPKDSDKISTKNNDSQPNGIDKNIIFESKNEDISKSKDNSEKRLKSKEKNSESRRISTKTNVDPKEKVCVRALNSKIDNNEEARLWRIIAKVKESKLEEINVKSTENNHESSINENLQQSSTNVSEIQKFLSEKERKAEQKTEFIEIQFFAKKENVSKVNEILPKSNEIMKKSEETEQNQEKMTNTEDIKTPENFTNNNDKGTKVDEIANEEKETKKLQNIEKISSSELREEKKNEDEDLRNPANSLDKNEEKAKVEKVDNKENIEKKKSQKIKGEKQEMKKKKENSITPVNLNRNEKETKIDNKENKKKSQENDAGKNRENQEKKKENLITPVNLKKRNKEEEEAKVDKVDKKTKETNKHQIEKENNIEFQENIENPVNLQEKNEEETKVDQSDNTEKDTNKHQEIEKEKEKENNKEIREENTEDPVNFQDKNEEETKTDKSDKKIKVTKKLQEVEKENNTELNKNIENPVNLQDKSEEETKVDKSDDNTEKETNKHQEIEKENKKIREENTEKGKKQEKKDGEEDLTNSAELEAEKVDNKQTKDNSAKIDEPFKEFVDLLKECIKRANDDDDDKTKNIELINEISKSNHPDEKIEQDSKKPRTELEASLSPDSLSEDEKHSSHRIENKKFNQNFTTDSLVQNSESESSLASPSEIENSSLQTELTGLKSEINLLEESERKPDLLLKEQNSSLVKEIEKLRDDLNSANNVIEKLRKQISIFQNIYPTIIDGNNLIKEALVSIEKNFVFAVEKE